MPRRKDYIHKRKDGRWEGRYFKGRDNQGKIIYGSVYGRSHKEAKEKLMNKYKELEIRRNTKDDQQLLFEDVLDKWLVQMSIRIKKSTLYKYETIIKNHIKPYLGKKNISELTSDELNTFISQKLCSGRMKTSSELSPSYVRTMAIILNSVMKYAMRENIISHKEMYISKPVTSKKELIILNQNEQKILELYLLTNISEKNLAIMISLYTGLRIGEVCALQWKDVDLDNHIINIRNSVVRVSSKESSYLMLDEPKTLSSTRVIPIVPTLYQLLMQYKKDNDIFVISGTTEFMKPRTLEYHFKKTLKKCELKVVNYHALRHTFATNCIQMGVDVKSLSEILGHSNVSVTLNTYVHSSLEMKRQQLNKIDKNENGQINRHQP